MFNEAFWFFYLIGLVEEMADTLFILAGITFCSTILSFPLYYAEEIQGAKKWHILGPILFTFLMIFATLVPSQQALYAGGAQYAVEVVEFDDTLMALKDIIDAKITELTPITKGE